MNQPHKSQPKRWMSTLPDDLPISEINIPGSHNAAAINTTRPTRWACQGHSITEQLNRGIRLLDIRLKPKKRRRPEDRPAPIPTGSPDVYEFITCHGHLGLFGANEFQSLATLLEECQAFLVTNPGETIILTIQIDDWRKTRKQDHPQMLNRLQTTISRLPLVTTKNIPTLKECRGRIYLINRINDDPALGVPLNIPDNTPGVLLAPATGRNYEVYVQDQYRGLNSRDPEAHKLNLTIAAIEKKKPGVLLLNYASATKPFGRFVYIMQQLLQYFADPEARSQRSGWLFLDYPFATNDAKTPDLPSLIIASNHTS